MINVSSINNTYCIEDMKCFYKLDNQKNLNILLAMLNNHKLLKFKLIYHLHHKVYFIVKKEYVCCA